VEWVQIDEPILATKLADDWQWAFKFAYESLINRKTKLLLTTYFGELKDNLSLVCQLPVDGLHIDAIRGAKEVSAIAALLPKNKVLSVGIVDGRNIWKSDLNAKLDILEPLHQSRGQKLWLAPSCSLIHVPISLQHESKLPAEVKDLEQSGVIIKQIAQMDADVITIETSRSDMALLEVFDSYQYPNEIGPGVYDIHSPNIPSVAAILALLEQASTKVPVANLWVNPDCGLKTRNWDEVGYGCANIEEVTG
jgi:methionine synthase II (cobalamin-independent)